MTNVVVVHLSGIYDESKTAHIMSNFLVFIRTVLGRCTNPKGEVTALTTQQSHCTIASDFL